MRHAAAGLLAAFLVLWGQVVLAAKPPEDARNAHSAGLRLLRSGNAQAALENFKEAMRLDPSYPEPILAAGRIYQEIFERQMHHYNEAADCFDRLVGLIAQNPPADNGKDLYQAHYFRGLLLLKGGEYKSALAELDKFFEVYPDFPQIAAVHNSRGIAHYYLDQYDAAVVCFKQALASDPFFAEARFNMRSVFTRVTAYGEAMVLYRAGELSQALKRVESLKDIAPRYMAGRRLEGRILADLGRPGDAIKVYREILGFHPNYPETYWIRLEMARLLVGLGKKGEAQGLLLENLTLFPTFEDLRARQEVVMMLTQIGNEK